MTEPVDAVLFDLDDTLCEYHRSGGDLLALSFETAGVDPFFTVEEYHARYGEFVEDSETVRDLRADCFAALAEAAGRDPATGRAVADAYAAERDHTAVRPFPGALEAIEALSDDHRIGMVTNGGPRMQRQKLAALGIDEAFETVVHGGYDAPSKPDPEPFHRALSDLDVPPERAVHVGNSSHADVPGAKAAGLRAVWFTGGEVGGDAIPDPEPDYRLDSMRDLTTPPWV
jgi:putative hydrolase of the HAD superfamily